MAAWALHSCRLAYEQLGTMKRRYLVLLLVAMGCADNPFRGPTPPALSPPPPPREESSFQRSEGSLWDGEASRRFLAFSTVATGVGDHITVLIEERAEAENKTQTKLDRTSSVAASIDSDVSLQTIVTRPILNLLNFLGFTDQRSDKNPSAEVSIVDAEGKTKFDGKGSSVRDAAFTTTLTCIVTEITEAGTMRIEGTRNLVINNETEMITLIGYVRPEDIRIDNSVPSTLLARTEIRYGGDGPLSGNQQEGWLTRLFNWILPF